MSKLSPKVLKIIAVVISVVLAWLVYSYLSDLQNQNQEVTASNKYSVVVATMDIPKNALIKAEMVKVVSVPEEAVQKDACKVVDDVVGLTAKEAIYSGEQVSKRRLLEDEKLAGFIGLIPTDKRAVSIAITDITGVAGFAKPGNYVDVLLVSEKNGNKTISGKILLQNMLLLAVNKDQNTEDKDPSKEGMATATLAASPEESVRLAVAQKQGQLYLALRPLHPSNHLTIASEISIYQGGENNNSSGNMSSVVPHRTPVTGNYSFTAPRVEQPAPRRELVVGEKINVIRGNTVQSVTTR